MKQKGILLAILISLILQSSDVKLSIALDEKPKEDVKKETPKKKVKSEKISSNSQLYGTYIDELKEKVYKKAKKSSNTVTREIIDLAFEVTNDRLDMDISLKEYLRLEAIHLAVMEIESNFDNSIINHNSTTNDYGIMQVNSMVIEHAMKGLEDNTLNVLDLKDNVQMGSWEIYECYQKAKEKHPDNVVWWFYAYYNRGLYFENYDWDYDDANKRSKKFIKVYKKYFRILYNE